MIRTARNHLIAFAACLALLGAGMYAVDIATNNRRGTAEYRVTWTGDAPPTSITYLAFGAMNPVPADEIAQGNHLWTYSLPWREGIHLHMELTQPLPYHGVTTAQILINGTVTKQADTKFGRKTIILDAG